MLQSAGLCQLTSLGCVGVQCWCWSTAAAQLHQVAGSARGSEVGDEAESITGGWGLAGKRLEAVHAVLAVAANTWCAGAPHMCGGVCWLCVYPVVEVLAELSSAAVSWECLVLEVCHLLP